ncbi:MAG: cardiolipin synthase [Verrucomicrobiota bacterium]
MVERLIEHPATWFEVLHIVITIVIAVRVIMRRPGPGVALAWVAVVAILPYIGALFYLLFGEVRISKRRAQRIAERKGHYEELVEWGIAEGLANVDWSKHPPQAAGMDRLGRAAVGFPTVTGSTDELFSDTGEVLDAIARDVDAAERSVLMEFYIWNEGGKADDVLEALIRAAKRGVKCRVLVDAVGGRPWWKGKQPKRLREAGVQLRAALPVGLYRLLFARTDLRMHRKIVVIDGKVAWTGSMNLVDPRFFKQEANVGEWVDAMARMEGTVVGPLSLVMLGDWMNECGETIHEALQDLGHENVRPKGTGDMQVVPSGVGETNDGLLQMLLATINSAEEELILTTPYFVPDDSMLRALRGAAGRGVKVDLIVPEKVDSVLTRYASRSYYDELMETGVRIQQYRGGLLHTKSITADRRISMFGTVNLDMRSLWINYEVALFVYGTEFGEHLHALQASYIEDSVVLDPDEWEKRSRRERLMENTFRLVSPIL